MQPVYVVFGTESGNAQGLAQRAGEALEAAGLPARVLDMLDFAPESLPTVERLLVITSTYGNGDPPSNAEALHATLMKSDAHLERLRFSVCGLGDTTYDRFAQCGKDFDRRLGELGATRILDRQDCDVDYEGPFEDWLGKVIPLLQGLRDADAALSNPPPTVDIEPVSIHHDPPGTRRNPVQAAVVANVNLNGAGSGKETRHLALSTAELPVAYQVGDSIGVWPENDPSLVEEILRASGVSPDEVTSAGGAEAPLRDLLARHLEIQEPDVRLVDRALATTTADERTAATRAHHVLDLLLAHPVPWTARELANHLRPLAPRLYSIASSPLAHPGEVHLLVDIVRYDLAGRPRMGVTSRFVSELTPEGARVPIYLHPSPSFRLAPPDRDIVMIGPGTGVAPFRAFLEERAHLKATGRSWLFFGSRHRATDFFYEDDFARFTQAGVLTRLDLAFSRDQAHKIYVQDRMREATRDLEEWIRGGAYVYVCGDAKRMAPDVHEALVDVIASRGVAAGEDRASARTEAAVELQRMGATGRYLRDVY